MATRRGRTSRARSRRAARRGGARRSVRYSRNGGGMLDDVKSWGSSVWNKFKSSIGYGAPATGTYLPTATYSSTPDYAAPPSTDFSSSSPTVPDYSTPSMPDYSASVPSTDSFSADTMSDDLSSQQPGAIGPYQNLGGRRRRRTRRMMHGGFTNSLTNIGMASPISGIQTARAHNWVGGGVTVVNDGDNEPDFFIGGTAHCRSLSAARRRR